MNELEIKQYYRKLGVPEEFIESHKTKNLHTAKQVVEGYCFQRELTNEEKSGIIKCILKRPELTKENSVHRYLATFAQNLKEARFSEQDAYGIIINLAINKKILPVKGYSFAELLKSKKRVLELKKHTDKIEKGVTEDTILRAKLGKTSRYEYKMERHLKEKGQMKQYYMNLGVPEEFIELVKIKNLRAAKEIVEGYDFGRELTNEEKSGILQAILNHSHLTRKTSTSLSSLIKALGLTGELTEQEIYGAIIKLSVNGGIDKHSYSEMINSSKYVSKFVEHYLGNKGTIDLKVTKSTIQRATADNLSEEQKSDLIEEFQRLGIPKRIVESIDTRNLWSAKQIVEGHNFGRELENEEKKALLQCILNHSHLGWKRKGRRYLSILMQNLEDAEFEEQEICGIIINTAVNRSIIPIKGYGYGELLCKRDKVLELKKYADEIDSEVTEYTIAKAKVMPIRIAKKAIGELAKKGDIAAIPTTGAQLTELERGETQTYEDPNK